MNPLPSDLAHLSAMLDTLPPNTQATLHYCFALMMVEAGVARLTQTLAGDGWPLCTFHTGAGDVFTIPKPPLNPADETAMLSIIREILNEETDLPPDEETGM